MKAISISLKYPEYALWISSKASGMITNVTGKDYNDDAMWNGLLWIVSAYVPRVSVGFPSLISAPLIPTKENLHSFPNSTT